MVVAHPLTASFNSLSNTLLIDISMNGSSEFLIVGTIHC